MCLRSVDAGHPGANGHPMAINGGNGRDGGRGGSVIAIYPEANGERPSWLQDRDQWWPRWDGLACLAGHRRAAMVKSQSIRRCISPAAVPLWPDHQVRMGPAECQDIGAATVPKAKPASCASPTYGERLWLDLSAKSARPARCRPD